MSKKAIVFFLSVFLFCIGIETNVKSEESPNRSITERIIAQIDFFSLIPFTFRVSPDNKRIAYGVDIGNKRFVVVDGKEEKKYDNIGIDTLIFSPDSRRLAYAARIGNKECVIVDGKVEKQYDGIVALGGGRIVFDSPDSLHYFALNNEKLYLIYEKIK